MQRRMKPENFVFAQPFLPSMNSLFSALFQCDTVGKPIPIRIISHLQMPRIEFSARGLEPTSNRESKKASLGSQDGRGKTEEVVLPHIFINLTPIAPQIGQLSGAFPISILPQTGHK